MSKYDAVYFGGDNLVTNQIRVGSSKAKNRGTFSGSLAALMKIILFNSGCMAVWILKLKVKIFQYWPITG